jgi:hypothetical protein
MLNTFQFRASSMRVHRVSEVPFFPTAIPMIAIFRASSL